MTVFFPTNTKETIDAIRNTIGRDVYIYTDVKVPCSGCSIDAVTGNSTNPFHAVCSGTGWITSVSGYTVKAHVYNKPVDRLEWVRGGQLNIGDAGIQIAYSTEVENIIDNCSYITVDNRKYDVEKKEVRGVSSVNRMIVYLKELTD